MHLSDEAILSYPEVSLLPKRFWELFDNEISDPLLELMRAEPSSLEGLIAQMAVTGLDELSKIKIWFAMAFSHQDMLEELLFNRAEQLSMTPELIFQVAVNYGKMPFFQYLMARFPGILRAMIMDSQRPDIFVEAIITGNVEIVNGMLGVRTPNNVWDGDIDRLYSAFSCAAANGHLNIMNRLVEVCPSENLQAMIQYERYAAFIDAQQHSYLDVMNRIMELCTLDNLIAMIRRSMYHNFSAEAAHAIINHLVTACTNDSQQAIIQYNNYQFFCIAVALCLPSVINCLHDLCSPDKRKEMVHQSLRMLAVYGNLEMLMHFIGIYDWVRDMVVINREELLLFARSSSTSNNIYDYLLSLADSSATSETSGESVLHADATPDPELPTQTPPNTTVGVYSAASHAVFFAGEGEVLIVPGAADTPSSVSNQSNTL